MTRGVAVGPLRFGQATKSLIIATYGVPAATNTGNVRLPHTPDYIDLSYQCSGSPEGGGRQMPAGSSGSSQLWCLTDYYLNASTGLLQGFWSASPTFATAKGTKVGMTVAEAQRRDGGTISEGCYSGILNADPSGAELEIAIHPTANPPRPTDLVVSLAADNGLGLLLC